MPEKTHGWYSELAGAPYCSIGGEDTKRTLKHVKDRAANLAERPQRVSSVTRITSTLRACANARTFLRSARSCFAPGGDFLPDPDDFVASLLGEGTGSVGG